MIHPCLPQEQQSQPHGLLIQLHWLALLSSWQGQKGSPESRGQGQPLGMVSTLGSLCKRAAGLQDRRTSQVHRVRVQASRLGMMQQIPLQGDAADGLLSASVLGRRCSPAACLCPWDHTVVFCCHTARLLLVLVLLRADIGMPSDLVLIVSSCGEGSGGLGKSISLPLAHLPV